MVRRMKKQKRSRKESGISLLLSIILVFCVLGAAVFSVSQKISKEMSASAIQNLSESLDLIEATIEAILKNEADFQKLIAEELAMTDDLEGDICFYEKSKAMVKISVILTGKTEGISSTGEKFSEEGLDFSAGKTVDGLPVTKSYVNYMGTWAYTMKCPIAKKDGKELGTLYIEYVYDSLDRSLPDGFYNKKASLYVMDAESERFVLKPKGMGERSAGHLNLEDFYRANAVSDQELQKDVSKCLENKQNMLFYHDIRGKSSLNYMWSVNDGMIYLVGYVPIEAIQQEGKTVTQNILIVVVAMLVAFFLCCVLYYLSQRQQNKIRKEQELEREIHNKQLAEALQAAQLANNSKTMFLSNMSHDIRTPMNAVLGFATLLDVDAENPVKVREYTKKIMASGKHLLSLINDILDVSKIESGKVVLNIEKFTLSDLVASVDAIIRPMTREREQNFYVEITEMQYEYFMGDETRLNQILINLLSNASKYTQPGGNIWFRILGQKQHSAQYGYVRIEVEDNGYGMTPEYLETIFDAFTRAENSTTNKVQGTGLGMAITKNIVELMGGTIEVFSEVDQGTLFQVDLELRIPEEQMDQEFWKENGIDHILVIDSQKEVCKNIQILMKDTNVVVDTVCSSEKAIEMLQEHSFLEKGCQMILLDSSMPGLEGRKGVEKIREILPAIPILFLSAYDTQGVEEALCLEHTGILAKPFFLSALKQKIMEMQEGKDTEWDVEETKDTNLEGMHFLGVEDNEVNAEILEAVLSIEGATCEIAENGQVAVERFEKSKKGEFDAILMDVQMPVMNGYEATRKIRALEREDAKNIPIIAMTANAFVEDEKEALDAGMNVHLSKPIDIDRLKKVIKEYTQGKEEI
ncbi:hypothetical protein C806_04130 [Lachnospiraceae bacterium 3-1]|nr:hypothetical protein C806_04130 [Lachnospiraceae bacterium 3-1]